MMITDALGQGFQPVAAGSRFVSLVPSVTETLFDFGLDQQVVGVTNYCIHPADRLGDVTRVGGTKKPDVARIAALVPDLIFANQEENRPEDVYALQKRGMAVFVDFPRTVEQAIAGLWNLARLTGVVATAEPLIRAIEQVPVELAADMAGRPLVRVFCPIWRDPWMTFNADTYVHNLLAVCGGENVFAGRERRYPLAADLGRRDPLTGERVAGRDTRYPRISLAEVEAQQPEVILMPSEPYCFSEVDRLELLQNLDTPATRTGQVYRVDGSLLTWPGTRLLIALREIPKVLIGK